MRHARSLAAPDDAEEADRHPGFVGRLRDTTSKLCNVLCAYELDRRLKRGGASTPDRLITVNAFDPGAMPGTGLAREYGPAARFAWNSVGMLVCLTLRHFHVNFHFPEESGRALARLVLDPGLESMSGRYFEGLRDFALRQNHTTKRKRQRLGTGRRARRAPARECLSTSDHGCVDLIAGRRINPHFASSGNLILMIRGFDRADASSRKVVTEVQAVARDVGRSPAQVLFLVPPYRPIPVIPILV